MAICNAARLENSADERKLQRARVYIANCIEGYEYQNGVRVPADRCEVDYETVADLTNLRGAALDRFVAATVSEIKRELIRRKSHTPQELSEAADDLLEDCFQNFVQAITPKKPRKTGYAWTDQHCANHSESMRQFHARRRQETAA